MLVGANLCIAHPIMWERVCRNPHDPRSSSSIRAGPRRRWRPRCTCRSARSRTWRCSTAWRNLLIERRLDRPRVHRRAHDRLRRASRAHVATFTARARRRRDRPRRRAIERRSPRAIHEGKRVSFWWTMGVNQSHEGVRTAQAIINLALMTGNIGRPGTGANSITGQCNAMGSRLFSNTTNLLGGRDFTDAEHRAEGRRHARHRRRPHPDANELGLRPDHRGRSCRGKITGLWVIATNPAHSWIDQADAARDPRPARLPGRAGHVPLDRDGRSCADLVLPAAGWGEKEGTFINSERRIGLIKKVARAPGPGARRLLHLQARRRRTGAAATMFDEWAIPEAVFQILKRALARASPATSPASTTTAMLDEARRHPVAATRGRCRGAAAPRAAAVRRRPVLPPRRPGAVPRSRSPRPLPEPTGRDVSRSCCSPAAAASRQWHTQTRTAQVGRAPQALPARALRRDQPGRRARARASRPNELGRASSRARGRDRARARSSRTPCSRARSSSRCTTRRPTG